MLYCGIFVSYEIKETLILQKLFHIRCDMTLFMPKNGLWAEFSKGGGGVARLSIAVNSNSATNFSYPNAISASLNARSSIKHQEALHG